jgi:hypothetical protein
VNERETLGTWMSEKCTGPRDYREIERDARRMCMVCDDGGASHNVTSDTTRAPLHRQKAKEKSGPAFAEPACFALLLVLL